MSTHRPEIHHSDQGVQYAATGYVSLLQQTHVQISMAARGRPTENNLAERSVRPLVITRKISGGTRSSKGSQTRMGLASLFGTWLARGLNPFHQCLALLTSKPSLGQV